MTIQQQLDRPKEDIDQKSSALANCKGIEFHQDNNIPHQSIVIHQKLRELGQEVLMHLPYGLNFEVSDNHLLRSMANDLAGKDLTSRET